MLTSALAALVSWSGHTFLVQYWMGAALDGVFAAETGVSILKLLAQLLTAGPAELSGTYARYLNPFGGG